MKIHSYFIPWGGEGFIEQCKSMLVFRVDMFKDPDFFPTKLELKRQVLAEIDKIYEERAARELV